MEMNQWHDASAGSHSDSRKQNDSMTQRDSRDQASSDAARHESASASMAKGQADTTQSRTADAKMPTQQPGHQDWAGECLFDCYNG